MKTIRKRLALTATLLVLLVAAANHVFALTNDITDNYYTDNTYTTAVGWSERYCDGSYEYGAPFTNYRYHEVIWCGGGPESAHCQYFDGSSWLNTTCPYEAATALSRIHIPIGS